MEKVNMKKFLFSGVRLKGTWANIKIQQIKERLFKKQK